MRCSGSWRRNWRSKEKLEAEMAKLMRDIEVNQTAELREVPSGMDHNGILNYIKEDQGKIGGSNMN